MNMGNAPATTLDATRPLKIIAELNRTWKLMRAGYLESRKTPLLQEFEEYKNQDSVLDHCETDAIILGFREAWRTGDYPSIVKVGSRLTPDFYSRNREAEAFYLAAKKRLLDQDK